jgi:trimeric autotransporter adhesin
VAGLSTTQLASFDAAEIDAFGSSQIAALRTAQIASLSAEQIGAFGTDDIAALTTAQARALTADQIVALTTTQITAFETADLAAMTMTQYNAFEAEDWGVMTTAQFAALQSVTPIVLDLDGNGIQTRSAAEGVSFDIDNTGRQTQVGWVGGNDGLLVRDVNGNGTIDSGAELFGGATELANGQRAGNGFAALSQFDSNADGKIDANDAAFNELKVWVDADADGVSDAGELRGLIDAGVASLNLDFTRGTEVDNGNLLGMVGSYTGTDGSESAMVDVWFAKQQPEEALPEIGDLLAADTGNLLGGATEGTKTAATPAVPVGVAPKTGNDDDWLKQQTPLV